MSEGRRRAAMATLMGTGASTAITVAQAFLLIPLALTTLGTPLYGAWIAAAELLVFAQSFDAGIPNLLTQRIGAALGRREERLASQWTCTAMLVVFALAGALGLFAVTLAPGVAAWAQVESAEAPAFVGAFRIGVVGSVLLLVYNGFLAIGRGVQMTGIINVGQVAGAAAGLSTSIVLLAAGFGVWALGLGLLVRGLVCAGSAALFLRRVLARDLLRLTAPSGTVLRDIVTHSPPLVGASAGYLLANNTEVILVTTFFGPTAAAIYGLTRRAADGVRHLIDAIAWAAYGAFAHLVTADDRYRARGVAADVLWTRLGIANVAGAVLLAINEPFVALLFGEEHFGGILLTMGFVLQMVIGGQAFLANYLYRAAGGVRDGAWLLLFDAVGRLVAFVAALLSIGIVAAPFASILVSGVALAVVRRRLDLAVSTGFDAPRRMNPLQRAVPFLVLSTGIVLGIIEIPASWPLLMTVAVGVGGLGAIATWLALPQDSYGRMFIPWKRV
jgi:O-antigen/teichoic acid export membrane protein